MTEKNKGGRPLTAEKKSNAGQPKTFESGEQLIELFEAFCEDIKANDYEELPTQTAFTRYLREHFKTTDRRTIYNALNKYFPNIKKEFEQLQSDIMAQGAAKGKYREAITIFALKNWCKWTDKQEIEAKNVNINDDVSGLSDDELVAELEKLGFKKA